MKPPDQPWIRAALTPLSRLYGAWMSRRNAHYDRPGAAARVAAGVISVGNLSAGGTGKTPMVRWLAETLIERGLRVGMASRGYGGSARAGPVLVSRGEGPLCAARVSGDEPWMLANGVAGLIVVVGADRTAAAAKAAECGAELVLLDDGFQHRALARDLDIVLLDRTRPFDRDRLLPAGLLREPATSLRRADWVVLTRSESAQGAERLEQAVRAANPGVPILHADHTPEGFADSRGSAMSAPARAVAFCAIGNPARFRRDLEGLGVALAGFHAFADHRAIDGTILRRLQGEARRERAALVTTEKDLARIGLDAGAAAGLVVLRIRTTVPDGARLIAAIEQIAGRQPA